MMREEDLKTLSHLGQALWVNPDYSARVSLETLTAVSSLDLASDRSLERVSSALLQRAMREGIEANASAVSRPFFRLHPEERFILSALHSGRWSYERLGRVLKKSVEQIAQLAWNARLHLVSSLSHTSPIAHPTGSNTEGMSCPEYDSAAPWTQRFLDDEMSTRERIFLQNHLLSCGRCRDALSRARNLYYMADSLVPRPDQDLKRIQLYARMLNRTETLKHPAQRTVLHSLWIFIGRRDVQLLICGVLIFIAVNLFGS